MDGRYIYAINDKQEVCKIDFEGFSLVMKRKLEGLSNPEGEISSHIKQVAPFIFAIGSVLKVKAANKEYKASFKPYLHQATNREYEANFQPYLHLVSGDLFDPKEELTTKAFEISSLASDPNRPVVFRSLYVKER